MERSTKIKNPNKVDHMRLMEFAYIANRVRQITKNRTTLPLLGPLILESNVRVFDDLAINSEYTHLLLKMDHQKYPLFIAKLKIAES